MSANQKNLNLPATKTFNFIGKLSTYVGPTVIYRGGNQSVYFGEETLLSNSENLGSYSLWRFTKNFLKKLGKLQRLLKPYIGRTDFVWKCYKIRICDQFLLQFGRPFWVRMFQATLSSFFLSDVRGVFRIWSNI